MSDDLSVLRLLLEWGADEALSETPVNRLSPEPAVAPLRPGLVVSLPARAPVPPASSSATTVEALMDELAAFEGCALRTTATQLVRPDGNPHAALVVLGDAPGADDDRSGRAFSGSQGHMVDRVLGTVGFDRESTLFAMMVPWRPPGNRRLAEPEISACVPFAHRLLAIVRPRCLVMLGAQTMRALTGLETPVRRLRGRWVDVQVQNEQLTIAALAMPTPDQWLSNAAAKQQLWSDLIALRTTVTTG